MVFDHIDNAHLYYALHPRFQKAFEFLKKPDILTLPPGNYEIDGDDVYVIIAHQDSSPKENVKLEVHRKFIDIQMTVNGSFPVRWRALAECENRAAEYDEENDFELYSDEEDFTMHIKTGKFAIYFPDDAHAPLPPPGSVHKAVVKVAV
ncbi:MAG: YhcH/YjgK/YiaL family protein [Bacteroidota bacterium]